MFKRFAAALAALIMAVSMLSGCFQDKRIVSKVIILENDVAGGSAEKTNLRFWMRAASKNGVTGMLVDKYNKENSDNTAIEFKVFGENYRNVVNMALASGNPPDLFELNGGLSIPQLAENGYILPLDRYISEDFKKNFYTDVFKQNQFYYKGKLYVIPERAAFIRLVYNTDIFGKVGIENPPATLEEMREDSKLITEAGRGAFYGYGAALRTSSTWSRFTDSICSISGLTGESAFDWSTGRFDFKKQKRALQYLIDLSKDGVLYPGPLNLDLEVSRTLFGQGKFAMMMDGNWQVAHFGNNEIKCDVNWDSAPIPVFKGDRRGKSYMWYDMGKLIAAKSRNPDKAWNFLKYLLDNQKEFVRNGEPLRTTINANVTDNIPLGYDGIKGFTDIQNSKAFPMQVQNFIDVRGDKADKIFSMIFMGQLDIDRGLEDLTVRYNQALDAALAEGKVNKRDILIPGFDYFNR